MANKTGNMMWIKGGESPNPLGRKLARQTLNAAVERFLKRNLTEKKLQALYDTLQPKDQLSLTMMLLPYALPKKADESAVSREEILRVNELIETKLLNNG
jgi:hypothetical protein